MDSTQLFGLALVTLSAAMLAWHWQGWKGQANHQSPAQGTESTAYRHRRKYRRRQYYRRQYRRRVGASGLIGVLGMSLTAYELIPQRPWPLTVYLLGLVLTTCWVIWLAVVDAYDTNQNQQLNHSDELTKKLRGQADIYLSESVERRN